ncbi:unnamed protein product [Amoebophrya sp. A25]|nr:unnamed protein product [Amoebophrya sp. A25]|eukprot:GSA25T00025199001.1
MNCYGTTDWLETFLMKLVEEEGELVADCRAERIVRISMTDGGPRFGRKEFVRLPTTH